MYISGLGIAVILLLWGWSIYGQYAQGWKDGYFKGLTNGRYEARKNWERLYGTHI